MMKLDLSKEEIQRVRDIIDEYRDVSGKLYSYQKKADEIQTKVIELEESLKKIKDKEDLIMDELHKKHGEFTIQDIYEVLFIDNIKK